MPVNKLSYEELEQKVRSLQAELEIAQNIGNVALNDIFNNISEPISFVNKNYQYVYVNNAYCENFCKEKNEIIGHAVEEFVGKENFEKKVKPNIDRCLNGEHVTYENVVRFKETNDVKHLLMDYYPHYNDQGTIDGVISTAKNITKEAVLRKNWNKTINSVEDFICVINNDFEIEDINEKGAELLKKRKEDIIGQKCHKIMHNLDGPETYCPVLKCRISRRTESTEIYEKKFDKHLSIKSSPVLNEAGEIIKYVDVIRDVSIQKDYEKTLKENEQLYRITFDHAAVGMAHVDPDGKFIRVNRKFHEMTGYTNDELKKINIKDISHPEDIELDDHYIKKVLDDVIDVYNIEKRYVKKNGEIFWANLYSSVVRDENGKARFAVAAVSDISEQKKTRKELQDNEQLFQKMLKAVPDMVSIHDNHMNILYSNWNGFAAVPEEKRKLHTKCYNTYRGYDKICPDCQAKNVIQTKTPFHVEAELPDNKFFDIRVIPLLNESGECNMFVEWVRDITDRKRMETSINLNQKNLKLRNEIAESFVLSDDSELFNNILHLVLNRFKSNIGCFGYMGDQGEINFSAVTHNIFGDSINGDNLFSFKENDWDGIWGESLKQRKLIVDNTKAGFSLEHMRSNNIMAAVVLNRKKVIGQIILADKKDGFNTSDINSMEELCQFVSPLLWSKLKEIENKNDLVQAKIQAEINELKYRTIFEGAPLGIFRSTIEGKFIEVNQALAEMLGYDSPGDVLDNIYNIAEQIYVDTTKREEIIDRTHHSDIIKYQNVYRRKNGEIFYANLYLREVQDEFNNRILEGMVEETTERIKYIEELKKAKEKAEESDRLKSAFLANMSHEIRTPMNGIIGFSEMFVNPDITPEKQKYYAQIVIDNSHQLLSIVNDILDISLLESNEIKISKEQVVVNDIIMTLYAFFKPQSNNKDITLHPVKSLPDEASTILTDKVRLQQIMKNLLNNAFKFTSQGFIKFGYVSKGDFLEFFVEDTGIGIAKDQQLKIFERFRQEELEMTQQYGGTGLGLSISQKLVDLLGGKIWVESEKNKGSVFYFTLPYKRPKQLSDSDTPTQQKNRNNHVYTILVAEDEEINYLYIEEVLEKSGYKLVHARDGLEAVNIFKKNPDIDMVLMDIKMPGMDGYKALKAIRKLNHNTPVVAQTAYAMPQDKNKILEAGFDDYLPKPLDEAQLKKIIRSYI